MDERIFKILKDSESEGSDTQRDEAFLANRISGIPENRLNLKMLVSQSLDMI